MNAEFIKQSEVDKDKTELNVFIQKVADKYDICHEAVEIYYNRFGNSPMFYNELDKHIKILDDMKTMSAQSTLSKWRNH